jgi:hypothetical protein
VQNNRSFSQLFISCEGDLNGGGEDEGVRGPFFFL